MEIGSKDALAAQVNMTRAILRRINSRRLPWRLRPGYQPCRSPSISLRERVAAQDVASVKEARSLLEVLQHHSYQPCSDSELNYFRQIVFGSDSIRDAGRIRGGRIECSGQCRSHVASLSNTAALFTLLATIAAEEVYAGIAQLRIAVSPSLSAGLITAHTAQAAERELFVGDRAVRWPTGRWH